MLVCSRWRSRAKNRKSLSLRTGPPIDPPNCWRLKGDFSPRPPFSFFSKKFRVLKASSRSKKYSEPCTWLVPDLVITLTAAPSLRPFTAEKRCVLTMNSCTASSGSCITWPPTVLSLSSIPLTVTFTLRPFDPLVANTDMRFLVGSKEFTGRAPGASSARFAKSRPFSGRFSIWLVVIGRLISVFCTSRS